MLSHGPPPPAFAGEDFGAAARPAPQSSPVHGGSEGRARRVTRPKGTAPRCPAKAAPIQAQRGRGARFSQSTRHRARVFAPLSRAYFPHSPMTSSAHFAGARRRLARCRSSSRPNPFFSTWPARSARRIFLTRDENRRDALPASGIHHPVCLDPHRQSRRHAAPLRLFLGEGVSASAAKAGRVLSRQASQIWVSPEWQSRMRTFHC